MKYANRGLYSVSIFYCQYCNCITSMLRKKCKRKEKNHIKHLYCCKCKLVTPHLEVRDCDHVLNF